MRAEACHTLLYLWRRQKRRGRRERGTIITEQNKWREISDSHHNAEENSSKEVEDEEEEGEETERMREKVVNTFRERLIVEDDPAIIRELTFTLRELGGRTEREDPLLSSIQGEVARLGEREALIRDVLETDRDRLTSYVIERPAGGLSTRDYLSHEYR